MRLFNIIVRGRAPANSNSPTAYQKEFHVVSDHASDAVITILKSIPMVMPSSIEVLEPNGVEYFKADKHVAP